MRDWLRKGRLRGMRPGGTRLGWRIPEAEVERFLEAGYGSPGDVMPPDRDTTTDARDGR